MMELKLPFQLLHAAVHTTKATISRALHKNVCQHRALAMATTRTSTNTFCSGEKSMVGEFGFVFEIHFCAFQSVASNRRIERH